MLRCKAMSLWAAERCRVLGWPQRLYHLAQWLTTGAPK